MACAAGIGGIGISDLVPVVYRVSQNAVWKRFGQPLCTPLVGLIDRPSRSLSSVRALVIAGTSSNSQAATTVQCSVIHDRPK